MVKRLLHPSSCKDTGWLRLILHIKVIFFMMKPEFFLLHFIIVLSLAVNLIS